MVFSLVYRSRTSRDWRQDELLALLGESRERNADHAVTGILLYRARLFMQLLEGDESTVMRLFGNIRTDPRHHDVELLWTDVAVEREFADWSMAFRERPDRPVDLPGYLGVLNQPGDRGRDQRPSVITDFLAEFAHD